MSVLTKEEWIDWKNSPVTRAFYAAVNIRIEDAKEVLASTAGIEPDTDNFYRGFIAAYREMLEFTIEDVEDES